MRRPERSEGCLAKLGRTKKDARQDKKRTLGRTKIGGSSTGSKRGGSAGQSRGDCYEIACVSMLTGIKN
jgi:hypothetical protein